MNLFFNMSTFNEECEALAETIDSGEPPKPIQPPALAEVWPNHTTHREEENFYADKHKYIEEYKNCNKDYPEVGGITGGIGHMT